MTEPKKRKRNAGLAIKADFTKKSKKEKEEKATIFSEGSQELKDLLLYMWNNGINTYACCAGHGIRTFEFEGKKISERCRQYIFFDISTFSRDELELLIMAVLVDKQKNLASFTFGLDNMGRNKSQRRGLGFHFNINYKSNFVYLLNILKQIKNGTTKKSKYLSKRKELGKDYNNFILAALRIFKHNVIKGESKIILKVLYLVDGLYVHCVDSIGRQLNGKYSSQKLKLAIDTLCDKSVDEEK